MAVYNQTAAQVSQANKANAVTTAVSTPLQNVINGAKTASQNLQTNYQNSQNTQTANGMINATVDSIAQKYGFDFSRDYAKQQAEVEAQAKRNTYNNSIRQNQSSNQQTMKQIDSNLQEGNTALDNSFFQDYMKQRQSQVNRGLNAGIAAEQDLRLGMNQQAQFANIYRDASLARNQETSRFNNESMRLNEALGLVEQERLAKESSLYQDLLKTAYDTLYKERSQGMELDRNEWTKLQDQLANELNISKMEADRIIQEAQFTGSYNGQLTVEQQQRLFEQRMEEARLALARQSAAGSGGGGSSRSSSSSSGSGASSSASSLVSAYNAAKASSSKSNIDKYYENQNSKLTNSVVRKPVVLPGARITPATDTSLSAWAKMKMMGG